MFTYNATEQMHLDMLVCEFDLFPNNTFIAHHISENGRREISDSELTDMKTSEYAYEV